MAQGYLARGGETMKPENPYPDRPKIVCLCGSTKFRKAFEQVNLIETLAGNIVLSVGCFMHADNTPITEKQKSLLDELHLRKIDLADEVLVLNVGDYIGESTRNEIEYAKTQNKPIRYLEAILPEEEKL